MNERIAGRDDWPRHHEAILTLNRVAIELKIHLDPILPRKAEITQELVDKLEDAIRDVEKCMESLRVYR